MPKNARDWWRRRPYPMRCPYCHLFACKCKEMFTLRPDQQTKAPERIASARWN